MSIIGIIASFDTKYHELNYVHDEIIRLGHNPFLIDISTGPKIPNLTIKPNLTREDVVNWAGSNVEYLLSLDKGSAIKTMAQYSAIAVKKLYDDKKIDGIIGMGGLQNTVVCSAALRTLPLGFPKIICSTIASGNRTFDTVVGDKDIAVIPSIVDFAGINPINRTVLTNTVAAIVGMIESGTHTIDTQGEELIAATLMGITNDTVMRASDTLKDQGKSIISFHSTGIGGRVMESLIREGKISAVMDMSLNEMAAEYFGDYGYSKGALNRLSAAAEMGIPTLVCPGGIDFICVSREDFFEDQEDRGYVWHTKDYLTHTRLHESEILEITETIINRLNKSKGPVTVLLPLGGLRTMSREGEFFYIPKTIQKMKDLFESRLNSEIRFVVYNLNFDDPAFADHVVDEMNLLLERRDK